MSAIWGNVSFHGTIENGIGERMAEPYRTKCKIDRYEEAVREECYFGCGIQYITKEAEKEILPYMDEATGIIITADCILDNRTELLSALGAEKDMPDGTLLRLAYEQWGMEFLKHIRGLYAIAIYEQKTKTLYLAADHVAGRCLYYYKTDVGITFSTLLRPILAIHPEIAENELYLKDYLLAPGLMPNISSTETPYQDVYKLNPGTYLKITEEKVEELSYWNPSEQNGVERYHGAKKYGMHFRKLYEQCVSDALRSNGEVGISMSSGFDSATVGVLAAKQLMSVGKKLWAYTYVPSEETTVNRAKNNVMNEQQDVEEIAAGYSNIRTHFLNNGGKNCLEELPEELDAMEIPFKAFVNFPNLCEIYRTAAAQGCKVLLTGQCGNSTVSHGYIDDVLYDLYEKKDYLRFLLWLNRYSKTVKESRKQALKGCLNYFRYAKKQYTSGEFSYQPTNDFLSEKICGGYPLEERFRKNGLTIMESVPTSEGYYHRMLYKPALFTYIGEWETKMGLKYGLVIRDATKDMRMLTFCYHLPYRYFAYRGMPRWLIRENLSDLLPKRLLDNWLRYGVQNADYLARIGRDWETLLPLLRERIEQFPKKDWIAEKQLLAYLSEFDLKMNSQEYSRFDSVVYLYTLAVFLKERKL